MCAIIKAFSESPDISNLLEPIYALLEKSNMLRKSICQEPFIKAISSTWTHPKAIVRVNFLKIISSLKEQNEEFMEICKLEELSESMTKDKSVLVREMARKVLLN